MKCPRKTLQNLLYFWNMKTHVFIFYFCYFIFFPNECPGLCRHRPGHSLGKKLKLHELKNEKNYVGFLIHKIWQILKHFTRALS